MVKSSTDINDNILEISLESFENSSCSGSNTESFYKGIYCLYNNNLPDAKKFLMEAVNTTDSMDLAYYEYLSFLGVVEVLIQQSDGGLNRCYNAVNGYKKNPELYLNIAYAEYILGNRQRSFSAIQESLKCDLKCIHSDHLSQCVEKRKNIKRKNPVKNMIGRLLRKKKNSYTGEACEEIFKNFLSEKLDLYIKQVNNKK